MGSRRCCLRRARLAAIDGDRAAAEIGLRGAAETLREVGYVFWTGQVELERAENLIEMGRSEEANAALDEASAIFERLGAKPWIERSDEARASAEGLAASAGI